MRSLRRTALLWMTAVITGVGLVGAATAYEVALSEADGFMDTQLRQIAKSASPDTRGRGLPAVRHDPEDDFVVQIWNADGRLTNAGEGATEIPRQVRSGFASITVDGTAWRVFTASDPTETIQVSQQVEVRRELAERAAVQVAIPLLALVPIGWLVVGWAMGRVLADLDRLARHVERLPADSRDPIDLDRVPSEAKPLVAAMNRLIERLRASLTQQRQFLSDAAHELRTPLTALNLQIANLDRADLARSTLALADLKLGARRATSLIEQLLRMARYDATSESGEQTDLDLRTVLLGAIADHVPLAESRSIDLGVVASQTAPYRGSERDLRVMFGNLIDNAIKYTPEGGTVDVGVVALGRDVEIIISDTGPGIRADLLPRVFDRFFRAAIADVEGSGLGLAVAEAIASRHGLAIDLANRTDRPGLTATVSSRPRLQDRTARSTTCTPAPTAARSSSSKSAEQRVVESTRDQV